VQKLKTTPDSDITIAGNTITKQTAWRSQNWSVKNLLELKNARRVSIRGNTFDYNWQAGQSGFAILFTVARQNSYGMIGANHRPGNDTISTFFPGSLIEGNALADADPSRYPGGNRFPSSAEFRAQFVAYAAGDYRLTASSAWHGAGTDGRDLGAPLDPPVGLDRAGK
jgi:hypothetical protein